MRKTVELEKAYRLMNHGPTVLISSSYQGKANVMAAAWTMPLDFSPPKVAIVIDKNSFSRSLIEKSGEFVICIPTVQQEELTTAVGSCSGKSMDKFSEYKITTEKASLVAAPLISGCVAWLECKLIPEPHIQNTYDLLLGEVVAAWADDTVFSHGRWHFTNDTQRTIHHVAGGHYLHIGDAVTPDTLAD
ncbi:flavin reductase family protein [Tolumonas osonensis]|uniref:Flavin reductase (DIM6/NTAB) family NADH-FMN oxidoreductase RutF n=1 Tax=Tolumonas osonensis TaxID=675874 RepID=A0A841GN76_9GAMM|nr:flavin reductase family protein [Tolumonas osonensis]MBB6056210.1 flavin reductase (DIM6/NTAB) family NADH-FMN oxidoreductase RutF [Tolumonas osonensis]